LFTYIDTLDDLEFLNKELLEKDYLGVDTEFRRTSKDNMRLALLQINDGEEIYLVDPILIGDPYDCCSFLYSPSVTKIFHSCKEDIEAIHSWTGRVMVNLFDTQLANAFLDGHYSIGYQGIVEDKLGITVDKGETRSNWVRRPLTDSQLNYAASDVEFLMDLYIQQKRALIESNKLDWHNEELDFLSSRIFSETIQYDEVCIGLSKAEEKNLLNKFNEIVLHISSEEKINPTLIFSKKSQKDFLRLTFSEGIEEASKKITKWRANLVIDSLRNFLNE